MTIKEVFEVLEQKADGNLLISAIKAETLKLRKEAEMKRKQCKRLQQELYREQQLYQAKQAEYIAIAKTSCLVAALYQGHALNPLALAELIVEHVKVATDERLMFNHAGVEYGLDTGVAAWLQDNAWAIQTAPSRGCRCSCQEVNN